MYNYYCKNCGKSYIPRRRGIQKYCSNSCRTRAFQVRKESGLRKPKDDPREEFNTKEKNPRESINLAGIGNAAIANLATDLAKGVFTKEENKPVTKKDLQVFLQKNEQRYWFIRNVPAKPDGKRAFFDKQSQSLIYLTVKY